MTLLPYIGSVINLGNSFSQATRPKNVGQMSDLIQEYRESTTCPSQDGWKSFYDEKQGLDKIDVAADKIWEYVQRIKKNLSVKKNIKAIKKRSSFCPSKKTKRSNNRFFNSLVSL